MPQCKGRHHKWNTAGTACEKCGEAKRGRGRPPGPARSKAGEAVAGRLAATLGSAVPPAPSGASIFGGLEKPTTGAPQSVPAAASTPTASPVTAAPPVTPPAAPPAEAPGWCKSAGKRLAQVFVATTELVLEKAARRRANDPDDDDVEAFGDAMGQQLAIWFPDTAMTPAKQLILASTFIVGGMCIGSEKLPPERPKIASAAKEAPPAAAADAPAAPSTSNVTPLRA